MNLLVSGSFHKDRYILVLVSVLCVRLVVCSATVKLNPLRLDSDHHLTHHITYSSSIQGTRMQEVITRDQLS